MLVKELLETGKFFKGRQCLSLPTQPVTRGAAAYRLTDRDTRGSGFAHLKFWTIWNGITGRGPFKARVFWVFSVIFVPSSGY